MKLAALICTFLALLLGGSLCPGQSSFYRDVYNFTGFGDGGTPAAGVTFDRAGNMYGSNVQFGNGSGVVWEIKASGGFVTLHTFGGTVVNADGSEGPDGGFPSGVMIDGAGDLYGTASGGGANSCGMVWEITASGVYLDLHDFGGTIINSNGESGPDGVNPYGGVAIDTAGDLFGTANTGGEHGFDGGLVWELAASGAYIDMHDFGGQAVNSNGKVGADGYDPVAGVSIDSAGDLFGTSYFGGANGGGMVWEITTSGYYKDWHDFGGNTVNSNGASGPDGANPSAGVTMDGTGNLYGTTTYGGPNRFATGQSMGIVWKISASGTYQDLHDFGGTVAHADGTTGSDGAGPVAAVTIDSAGNLYGTTANGGPNGANYNGLGMAWELTAKGSYLDIHDFGGNYSNPDGTGGTDGSRPQGSVTIDNAGNLFSTASSGGVGAFSNGFGMVWEITADGAVSVKSVTVSPITVEGGSSSTVTGTITLTGKAPSGGANVHLASSNSAVTVPSSVTVAQGSSTATFSIKTKAVGSNASVIITADLNGIKACSLTVTPPKVEAVTVSPTSVVGGNSTTLTVTIDISAPAGGLSVPLTSSDTSVAQTPNALTIAAGSTKGTATVTTNGVASDKSATIGAASGGVSKGASLTVTPATVKSVSLNPSSVYGGANSTATVTLNGEAPAGGLQLTITSSSLFATPPSSSTVPAGKTSGTFTVGTKPVNSLTNAVIKAAGASATLTIKPAVLSSVVSNVSSLMGGGGVAATITATLGSPAGPSGVSLTLSPSPAGDVKLGANTITIPSGKTSATVTATPMQVTAKTTVTITAALSGTSKSATLTDLPPLATFTVSPTSVVGGSSTAITGTVTLNGAAPTGGLTVLISSSNAAAAPAPASVKIAAGAKTGTFSFKTKAVSATTSVVLTAKLGNSLTAALTVKS